MSQVNRRHKSEGYSEVMAALGGPVLGLNQVVHLNINTRNVSSRKYIFFQAENISIC